MGIQWGEPWRWLTTATTASIRSRYSAYSGTSVRDGISWAMKVTRSLNSGCWSRKTSKAGNPRRDVFGRAGAADAQHEVVAPAPQQLLLELERARPACDRARRLRIDRQRV